ncbi:zinc metalloprotease [Priestia aryabhattai]|uniref:hypothetical protein n=1 Tax=Priestia aryabhattai TaxID=412384 RepID=UPI003736F516
MYDELNLSNDYDMGESPLLILKDIQKESLDVRSGLLILAVFWFHGAVMEGPADPPQDPTSARIAREIKAANSIWRTPDGSRKIEFRPIRYYDADFEIVNVDAETLSEEKTEAIMSLGNKVYPSADCFVFYIPGENFSNGAVAKAYKRYINNKEIYFIIMSNGARARIEDRWKKGNDYALAHELGHILYYSNSFGNNSDPDPNGADSGHHNAGDKGNLMCPTLVAGEIPTLKEEQIKKGLESKFFVS